MNRKNHRQHIVFMLIALIAAFIVRSAYAQVPVYDSAAGPYFAYTATSGVIGVDDYTASVPGNSFALSQLRFVGGVTSANSSIQFQFQSSSGTPISTFAVNFTNPGNFVYDIPASYFPSGAPILLPSSGRLQLSASTGTTGQWFFTSTAPAIGTNSSSFGTGASNTPSLYGAFALYTNSSAPEPNTLNLIVGMFCITLMALLARSLTNARWRLPRQ